VTITGADGRQWWVGRRWLPWRPKKRDVGLDLPVESANLEFGDEPIGCLIVIAVAVLLIAFPFLLIMTVLVAEWLLVLLFLPAAVIVRVALGKPWVISARGRSASGERWRYAGEAKGWWDSREAIRTVRDEIAMYGEPRSLPLIRHKVRPADTSR
jgi:hypothetical protein